jgi:hypothetical protein
MPTRLEADGYHVGRCHKSARHGLTESAADAVIRGQPPRCNDPADDRTERRTYMRRLRFFLGMVGCLIWLTASAASAGTLNAAGSASKTFPTGCKRAVYTADGGYFSQGHFYWEPSDTVTLKTRWCFAKGVITSHAVSHSTTIPNSLNLQISTRVFFARGRAILNVQLNGDYDGGVINNVGFISIVGDVTRLGHHHFTNASGSGG